MTDFAAIVAEANAAATVAAQAENAKLPPEAQRGLDCGFANLVIRPATTPFVRFLKSQGIGSKNWNGGWYIGCTGFAPTQSISVHEAAARAYRDVLGKYDIDATVQSRLD